jgi:antitoxin HicB
MFSLCAQCAQHTDGEGPAFAYCKSKQPETRQAQEMLEEAILGVIANKEEVPIPSLANGRPVVRLPALTAAKLELYRAMRHGGLEEVKLAKRLGWPAKKIAHIFDGYHAVRLEQLEAALAALGRRLVVTLGTGIIEQSEIREHKLARPAARPGLCRAF